MGSASLPHLALVIAHDPWARAQATERLRRAGYRVRGASNGFSGLRLARAEHPHLVLVGSDLPEVPEREVLRELAELPPTDGGQGATEEGRMVVAGLDAMPGPMEGPPICSRT